jgi:DNA invertase Pin-like site-specific DNA recombinase
MARARKRTPKRTSNAPRRVAVGLCRCSTDRQDRSIAEQEAAIRAWAKQHRTRLLQVFKDEGVSGLQLSRPGLNACLDFLAKSPHKGTVVLWSRDRLVRPEDPIDGLVMERQVRYAGWELCYLTGSNATGNSLVDAILGLVEHHASGEYLRKLARDSLRNVIARLKAGDVPGGKIPYGYAKAVMDESGKIVRTIPRTAKHRKASLELTRLVLGDPDEVRAVRWIFDEYNRGWSSPSDLSDELNRRKAPCPTKRPWNKGTVRDILQNAVYVGDIVWNRETTARCVRFLDGELSQRLATHASRRTGQRIAWARNDPSDHIILRDQHEPIVSRATFSKTQAIIARRGQRAEGLPTRRSFPLTGLVHCAECGHGLMSRTCHSKGRIYRYYVCPSAVHPCHVRADTLERAVLRALARCCRSLGGRRARMAQVRRAKKLVAELEAAMGRDERAHCQAILRTLVERVVIRTTVKTKGKVRRRCSKLITAELLPKAPIPHVRPVDLLPDLAL